MKKLHILLLLALPFSLNAQFNVYTGHLDQFGNFEYWGLPGRGSLKQGEKIRLIEFMPDSICIAKKHIVNDCGEPLQLSDDQPYWFSYSDTILDGSSYNSYPDGARLFYTTVDSAKLQSFYCQITSVKQTIKQNITGHVFNQNGVLITSLKMDELPEFLKNAEKGLYFVRFGNQIEKYAKLLD